MKKNISSLHKSAQEHQMFLTGLFSNRQSRERILEQLKIGTLFRFNQKRQTQISSKAAKPQEEPKTWLDQIKLGLERPEQRPITQVKDQPNAKKVSKLPCIMKCKEFFKENKKERRCDKVTCMTKKLSKIAAWNKDNSHNIDQNVEKLERSLNLDEKSLSQNDFRRVEGLSSLENKSLETSLIELDKSSILDDNSCFNPFSNFPNFTDSIGPKKKHKTKNDQKTTQSSLGNSFIPEFLMSSIMVNSPRKSEFKRVAQ